MAEFEEPAFSAGESLPIKYFDKLPKQMQQFILQEMKTSKEAIAFGVENLPAQGKMYEKYPEEFLKAKDTVQYNPETEEILFNRDIPGLVKGTDTLNQSDEKYLPADIDFVKRGVLETLSKRKEANFWAPEGEELYSKNDFYYNPRSYLGTAYGPKDVAKKAAGFYGQNIAKGGFINKTKDLSKGGRV